VRDACKDRLRLSRKTDVILTLDDPIRSCLPLADYSFTNITVVCPLSLMLPERWSSLFRAAINGQVSPTATDMDFQPRCTDGTIV